LNIAGALGAWEPSLFHHRARRARVWSSEKKLICHQFSWLKTPVKRFHSHSNAAMDDHLFPIPSNLTNLTNLATGEAKQFWSETNTLWGLGSRPTGDPLDEPTTADE